MASNSKRGGIEFEAAGVTYTLRVSTNALVRFQDAEGKTALAALRAMESGDLDMHMLRAVMQHCLSPARSADEVGDLMDEIGILQAAALIGRAAQAAFPVAPEGKAAADPLPAPSKISSVRG